MKFGLAGAGAMGRNHARVISKLDRAELVAVYDADFKRAKEVAAEYGAEPVKTLEELAEKCEAVSVAVPTIYHLKVGGELMRRGANILVEKPIAGTIEEARELVKIAEEENKVLAVGHIERFNPVMKTLEKQVGYPRFIEAQRLSPFPKRSTDIGVVLDLMIHDIEIILHLVKSPIVSVDAVGIPVITKNEDIANARIRFENGAVANITSSRISADKLRKIRVFQGDAYLSLDYQNQEGKIVKKGLLGLDRKNVPVEKAEPLYLELQSFAEAIREQRDPEVTGQQGLQALQIALQIIDQIKSDNDKFGTK